MAESEKNSKKPMDDVTQPGKSAPSATSRPIIVTHGPMMQDPMVQKEAKPEEVKLSTVAHEKVINEPTSTKVEVKDGADSVPIEVARAEEPKPAEKPELEVTEPVSATPSEPKPDDDSVPLDGDSGAAVEAVADAAKDKKKTDDDQKEIEAMRAKVDQLVAERKYYVPLGVASHKRHHRTALIIVLILLAAAVGAAAFAYDAGLLDDLL